MNSVLICGDLAPINGNEQYFSNGDVLSVYNDIIDEIEKSDLVFANLECPLTDHVTPIVKVGPALKAGKSCINGIAAANFDVIGLANNHIMDYGERGLIDTLSVCSEHGLDTVGAGRNLQEAGTLLIKKVNNVRLGFWAIAEHEWSIAGENSYGANPVDVINYIDMIKGYKDLYDFLIIIIHGGKEHYPYPSPGLMKLCRFMATEGANAIICQHTHIAGCYEIYNKIPIIYGQGNFIFDYPNSNPSWREGFLVKLNITNHFDSSLEILPIFQSEQSIGAKMMTEPRRQEFISEIEERSKNILQPDFVIDNWTKTCLSEQNKYVNTFKSYNRLLEYLDRKFKISRIIHRSSWDKRILSYMRCETHREAIISILEQNFK